LPDICILTPHHQEMKRLLQDKEPTLDHCQKFVEKKKVTVVLKGGPSFVFHAGDLPLVIPRGDPGMATAGTGDVLTGIIAAMLARKLPPREAAALGVYLHALSGEAAAFDLTSPCLIASDLIHYLPEAFSQII
jgi:ADP-dependent NAD(P)H-hydrate dehydratase / NAD(P)H-hydrate epimerase